MPTQRGSLNLFLDGLCILDGRGAIAEGSLEGARPFSEMRVVKDGKYVYSTEPKSSVVGFTWRDSAPTAGKTGCYYVRANKRTPNCMGLADVDHLHVQMIRGTTFGSGAGKPRVLQRCHAVQLKSFSQKRAVFRRTNPIRQITY